MLIHVQSCSVNAKLLFNVSKHMLWLIDTLFDMLLLLKIVYLKGAIHYLYKFGEFNDSKLILIFDRDAVI